MGARTGKLFKTSTHSYVLTTDIVLQLVSYHLLQLWIDAAGLAATVMLDAIQAVEED